MICVKRSPQRVILRGGKSDPGNSKAHHLSKIIEKDYSTVGNMILAGDFNYLYDSHSLKYLYGTDFNNSRKALDIELSDKTSLCSQKVPSGRVIDHILFKGLEVKSAGIIEENGKKQSDHKPVWSVFEL